LGRHASATADGSTLVEPSASAKVIIILAVSAMHGQNAPVEAPTPG
jgi:hypothetical protein